VVWDSTRRRLLHRLSLPARALQTEITCLAFSPDGSRLLSGVGHHIGGSVDEWDWKRGTHSRSLSCGGPVHCLSFSPDGATLAVGEWDTRKPEAVLHLYQGCFRLWDFPTSRVFRVLRGHAHGVSALAYSPDGKTLATGDPKGVIRIWPVR
jgi:WD40 repeat protein